MKLAETVTFGGSALDRAGELRADPVGLAAARSDPAARTLVFWRGKVLVRPDRPASAVRLPLDHPALGDVTDEPVLLGREGDAACFAVEISAWDPDGEDLSTLGSFVDPSEQRHPALPDTERFAELRRIMTWLSPRDAELAATGKAILGWHDTHRHCARCGSLIMFKQQLLKTIPIHIGLCPQQLP